MTAEEQYFHVRWMLRRDMTEVLDIGNQSLDSPLAENELLDLLRIHNVAGIVAEADDKVLGFAVYCQRPKKIALTRLAVHPEHRRTGVGSVLVRTMIKKMNHEHQAMSTLVREHNLGAQMFLKSLGFIVIAAIPNVFNDCEDSVYLFEYRQRREPTSSIRARFYITGK